MLPSELERFVAEDIGEWDLSSSIVTDINARAVLLAKEDCIISGLSEAGEILGYFGLDADQLYNDGEFLSSGSVIMIVQGSSRKILQAERLVLNFLARMSGISTLTRDCVLRAHGVKVAATRKTTPGFRIYEKRAVFFGGGDTHRFNLSDSVLIKDNHIKLMGLEECVRAARRQASFTKKIEVEVEDLNAMQRAADLGVDIIMFDNMLPSEIKKGVEILKQKGQRERVVLEASGNITLDDLEEYAGSGIDVISLGMLTRNARWIDISLEIEQSGMG
ncbi:MAG: carboxylating nicotinate-nucleotide diphosphorylase [Methanotrichaceae archaeon]|jgi:nicotinate-nucleotide pyrophosphorylase (carboxylating)